MIKVTRLDGKTYYLNPHQIESMELKPDLTITMLSGKNIIVKESPEDVIDRIVKYRKSLGIVGQEL